MAETRVYEPCEACGGAGSFGPILPFNTSPYVPNVQPSTTIQYGPRTVCYACGGSGKGKLKEIHDV